MSSSFSAHLPIEHEPLAPYIQSRHKWAMQLLLADGVARRLEEWPARTTAPLYAGWFPALNPGRLRQQTAAFLNRILSLPDSPSTAAESRNRAQWPNWTLYACLYGYPFKLRPAPNIDPDLPPLSFLRTDFPVPLHIIWAQTGFPHVIAAAWLLSLHHPLLNLYGDLSNPWYAFYQRQLLEWRIRRHWLRQLVPYAKGVGVHLPEWLFHDNHDPWYTNEPGTVPRDWHWRLAVLDGRWSETDTWHQLNPAEKLAQTFTPDWYARSWHPASPYRQKYRPGSNRLPKEAPEVIRLLAAAWDASPQLGQVLGMFIEQYGVLEFFAPLRKYFCAAKTDTLTPWLRNPEAAVVYADFLAAGVPPQYEVF